MVVIKEHTVIVGVTGSGKTYLTRYLIDQKVTPFTLFFNTQDEIEPKRNADIVIDSPNDLLEVFEKYSAADICYQPSEVIEEAKEELLQIKDILFAIGKQVNSTNLVIKNWLTFYIDEVTDYSPKSQPDAAINLLYRRGRRHGIIMVSLTQRPALTSQTILTQSTQHIYFKVEDMERLYFTHYFGDKFDDLYPWLDRQYHFVLKQNGIYTKEMPVK